MNDTLWACAKRIGITWVGFVAILIVWGMVMGAYARGIDDWHMLAFVALVVSWFIILDMIETAKLVYATVNEYAKRNKES
jgi:hypothetical protein